MAKNAGIWGIDIGQAAFKALRCTLQDGDVVADAFDYIEYPKILSQPEAEPEKMIRDAIDQFLSRNDVNNYRVARSSNSRRANRSRLRWKTSFGISSRWAAAMSMVLPWKRKSACLR
jgi:hypothetical protein